MSAVAVACFFLGSATAFLSLGLTLALLAQTSRIPTLLFWRSLRPVWLLALFTILAGATINHSQTSFEEVTFSLVGLKSGGLFAGRIVVITLLTTLFFLTTKSSHTIALGIRSLAPLRLLDIKKNELSLLVHLAYRFVPLLRVEISEMQLGRKARNLSPPKSLGEKFQLYTDSLNHLFIGALQRAETTAMAMQQRGLLENWESNDHHELRGWGGWQAILLALVTAMLLLFDGQLL